MDNTQNHNKEITLQEILFILSKQKILMIGIVVLSIAISVFYSLTQKSIYKSTGMIMIENNPCKNHWIIWA